MNYWLVKSEPDAYSWDNMVADKEAIWDGVRNYAARNNLKAMKKGDTVFFYHSVEGKEIVGTATVTKEFFPDPKDDTGTWVSVKIKAKKKFKKGVTLEELKANPKLKEMKLLKIGRLSVSPVTEKEYAEIMKMAGEK